MKFYDKYFKNNYEELITYYPRFYREVFEMVEILKAHGRIADELEDNIEQTFLNCFIDYADERIIRKLEAFLGIEINNSRTLEERRRLVKSYFVGYGKVSASLICQMIGAYTNTPVSCKFEPFDEEGNNLLYIDFLRRGKETIYMSDILTLLSRKLPAHIEYRAELVYRFPIVIGRKRTHYKHDYDYSGTKPDTALVGVSLVRDTITKQKHSNTRVDYKHPHKINELAGLYPETAMYGRYFKRDAAAAQKHVSSIYEYEETGNHQQTGQHPETAFLGEAIKAALGVEIERKNSLTDYGLTGTKPETALLADAYAEVLAVEKHRENTLTEYEATGIKPETAAIAHETAQISAVSRNIENYTTDYEKTAENARTGANPSTPALGGEHVIDATTGATASEYSVNYTPCGTTFTQ